MEQQHCVSAVFVSATSPKERVEEPRDCEDDEEDAFEGAGQLNLSVALAQAARDTSRRGEIRRRRQVDKYLSHTVCLRCLSTGTSRSA